MYILHLWDQAGVAFILAKFQRKKGDRSQVIRVKGTDKYGIDEFYKEYGLFVTKDEFIPTSIVESRKADVIHIHSLPEMVIKFRRIYGKSKIIILHYHGTDARGLKDYASLSNFHVLTRAKKLVRNLLRKRLHLIAQRLADKVIVSTPDLLQIARGATLLPNPVDTDHFKLKPRVKKTVVERAVIMNTEATNTELAVDFCKRKGIGLNMEIYDRIKNPISHSNFPKFFDNFDIYVDLRYVNGKLLQNLSLTAMQALASGLRVLNYNFNLIDNLPSEDYPASVVAKLSFIYSQKMKKNNSVLVAKLLLEQLPLDIIYFFYVFTKNCKQRWRLKATL